MRKIIPLFVLNILSIMANIIIMIGPKSDLLNYLSRLPPAWGAFVGAVVGFIGVAWTAHKGFSNLIKAQEHRADIEIKAREHQYSLDEAKYKRENTDKANLIAGAIAAELSGLLERVHDRQTMLRNQIIMLEVASKSIKEYKTTVEYVEWRTPIWDSFAPDVGILGASVAADIISVYSKCSRSRHDPINDVPAKMAITLYRTMHESNELWCKDILFVAGRLVAFSLKENDPGPLFLSSHRRMKRIDELGQEAAETVESRFKDMPSFTLKT